MASAWHTSRSDIGKYDWPEVHHLWSLVFGWGEVNDELVPREYITNLHSDKSEQNPDILPFLPVRFGQALHMVILFFIWFPGTAPAVFPCKRPVVFGGIELTMELWVKQDTMAQSFHLFLYASFLIPKTPFCLKTLTGAAAPLGGCYLACFV